MKGTIVNKVLISATVSAVALGLSQAAIGETLEEAVGREVEEELGITACEPVFLYKYIHSNTYETELVHTYSCIYSGTIIFQQDEITLHLMNIRMSLFCISV